MFGPRYPVLVAWLLLFTACFPNSPSDRPDAKPHDTGTSDIADTSGDTEIPGDTELSGDTEAPPADTNVTNADRDGDGYSQADGDCDDTKPSVNPSATDVLGDGIDQNCDGIDGTDVDGDGYASTASGGPDCDDADPQIHGGQETCGDGVDSDCDGFDDGEDALGCLTYFLDADQDTYGEPGIGRCFCPGGDGLWTATTADDCYDANPSAHPGVTTYFVVDRGDGSYDYDCDTAETLRWPSGAQCSGCCVVGGQVQVDGWYYASNKPLAIPGCGESEMFSASCLCNNGSGPPYACSVWYNNTRSQECR